MTTMRPLTVRSESLPPDAAAGWRAAAVATLVIAAGIVGCEETGSETPSEGTRHPERARPVLERSLPTESCYDSAIGSLAFAEEAAVVAQGFATARGTEDMTWTPGRITDLAVGHEGLYVLDVQANEVHWLDADLGRRRLVASEGGGPDETRAPRAIAAGPELLWVLDAGKRALLGYDRSGSVVSSMDLPRPATEVAVDGEGRIYLTSRTLWRFGVSLPGRTPEESGSMRRSLGQTGVLVSLDPSTGSVDSVSLTRNRAFGRRPLVEPFASRVRLRGLSDGVAVLYPRASWIDLYRGDDLEASPRSLKGCWPEALDAYYREARERSEEAERPRQRGVTLISDVAPIDDSTFAVLSPRPTEEDRYHLDTFSVDGSYRGSYVGPRRLALYDLARLTTGGNGVYAADLNGSVVRLRVDRE